MRKKKLDNQKKIIIIGSLCLLLCLCVGYAAFQTTISLKAKGNVKEKPAAEKLKELVVTTGDGLYEDAYEEGRYFYKGSNPNNYITFNNETWRIISVESDGTIKILRNSLIGSKAFDSQGLRDSSSNGYGGPYCANGSLGCNAWSSTANMVGTPSNFTNGSYSGSVDADSEMLTYLNGEYYNGITDKDKIVGHNFSIGSVTDKNNDLAGQITSENSYEWNGNVGLITASEYIRANNNQSLCGNLSLNNTNKETCKTTNWMYISGSYWWTLSPDASRTYLVWNVDDSGYLYGYDAAIGDGVRPAFYISADIKLSGEGTELSPYIIE